MSTLDDVLAKIDANQTDALARLFALLAIPSVSADPAHFPDCESAADWLVRELAGNISDPAPRKVFLEMDAVREVLAGAAG